MELRSGIYKGVHGVLPVAHRAQFEDGVNLLFSSWTALCLAIDNEWGGPASRQKAEQLYQDVLAWFYGHTGVYFSLLGPVKHVASVHLHLFPVAVGPLCADMMLVRVEGT